MIISAFDIATATGVCDGAVGGAPRLFSWFLDDAGKSRPARLLALRQFLCRYFEKEPCDGVVYEAPMPLGVLSQKPGKRGMVMSEANVSFARGAIGVLEMTCAEYKKPVEAVAVQSARSSVLGWGLNVESRSGINTKARVMRDLKMLKIPFENDNEADAYVLWQYACNLNNPRLALYQTPLFRQQVEP